MIVVLPPLNCSVRQHASTSPPDASCFPLMTHFLLQRIDTAVISLDSAVPVALYTITTLG